MMLEQLNAREDEVLVAVADGLTNGEIAAELHLSEETIKGYVKCILRKMRARNRAHAVALAYHRGILKPMLPS